MKPNVVCFLPSVKSRIPLDRVMGYYKISNALFLFILLEDLTRYFIVDYPQIFSILEPLKYIAAIAASLNWLFSPKQSVIELVSLRLMADSLKGKSYYFFLHLFFIIFLPMSVFYLGGNTMAGTIILSCIPNGLILLYFFAQYRVLKCGDDMLESAAEGILTASGKGGVPSKNYD